MDYWLLLGLRRATFSLETPLTVHQLERRLAKNVEPNRLSLWWRMPDQAFRGVVTSTGFRLVPTARVLRGRLDARPLLIGTFHPRAGGSRVEVVLRPRAMVVAHMLFWWGLLLPAILLVASDLQKQGTVEPQLVQLALLVAAMSTAGWSANYLGSENARSEACERLRWALELVARQRRR